MKAAARGGERRIATPSLDRFTGELVTRLMMAHMPFGGMTSNDFRLSGSAAVTWRDRQKPFVLTAAEADQFAVALMQETRGDGSVDHRASGAPGGVMPGDLAVSEISQSEFLPSEKGDGLAAAKDVLNAYLARGMSVDDAIRKLFPAAARRLGDWWESDDVSFADVSIGLCRLHGLLRDDSWRPHAAAKAPRGAGRVLLGSFANDQHSFGLSLVADAFRRDGWRVVFAGGASPNVLAGILREGHFDALAMSASNQLALKVAARTIARLRKASCNKHVFVITGGAAFEALGVSPERLGVDLISQDPEHAAAAARQFVMQAAVHRSTV